MTMQHLCALERHRGTLGRDPGGPRPQKVASVRPCETSEWPHLLTTHAQKTVNKTANKHNNATDTHSRRPSTSRGRDLCAPPPRQTASNAINPGVEPRSQAAPGHVRP